MKLGGFRMTWFVCNMADAGLTMTKPFRDFISLCVAKHRLGDSGDYEAVLAMWHMYGYKQQIERNRIAYELQNRGMHFSSYWEVPDGIFPDNGKKYFFSICTQFGLDSEFGINYFTDDQYNAILLQRAKQKADHDVFLKED